MANAPQFILASQSPARRQLLERAGIPAIAKPSYFDEDQIQLQDPGALVEKLAICKAQTIAKRIETPALILGCDSVLAVNGKIYGKPASEADAIASWQQMRGHVGQLFTGHALMDTTTGTELIRCQITEVHFAFICDRTIAAYVKTQEPLHCAGCFALDGKGGLFIDKIVGCHSNVIGLSLPLLRQMLSDLGYTVPDFWL